MVAGNNLFTGEGGRDGNSWNPHASSEFVAALAPPSARRLRIEATSGRPNDGFAPQAAHALQNSR